VCLLLSPFCFFCGEFWLCRPALLYGLSLFLGLSSSLNWHYSFCLPIFLLLLCVGSVYLVNKKIFISRLSAVIIIGAGAWIYGTIFYTFPELPPKGLSGEVEISIDSVSSGANHFSTSRIYRGTVSSFTPDDPMLSPALYNIPYSLYLPSRGDLPLANQSYRVKGVLKDNPYRHAVILKVKKNATWSPVEGSCSIAQWRFQAKELVKNYIHKNIKDSRSSKFLSGLATGEFNDRTMLFNFGRLGLQHIMAISGFHFGIITSLLSFLLSLVFSPKKSASLLIICLASYFLFLGCGPSIQRAWVSSLIVLLGTLAEKRSDALNVLGLAMLATLLANPLSCENLGFHFSFLTTGSILLFYGSLNSILKKVFVWEPLSKHLKSSFFSKLSYIFSTILRQSLSLLFAVHIVAIPCMLYFFHKFPWMGLIYNLFFPFLVSVSLALLLGACLSALFLPPLSSVLHWMNKTYTTSILNLSYNVPPVFDLTWRSKSLTKEYFVMTLCLLFLMGIFLRYKTDTRKSDPVLGF
jgi:competence protein ComEC